MKKADIVRGKLADGIRKKDAPSLPKQKVIQQSPSRRHDTTNARTARESGILIDATPDTRFSLDDREPTMTDWPREKRANTRNPDKGRQLAWLGVSAACIAIAGVGIFISTVGASTTIAIKPRVDEVAIQNIAIHFDMSRAAVALKEKTVPSERLTLSKNLRREFDATATEEVHVRAHGKTRVYNQFSSAPQTFVGTTRFITDS